MDNMASFRTYDFGVAEIHEDYLIVVMNEGITVSQSYNRELIALAKTSFSGKKFGYISHRKNSYSVDPRVYLETSKIENLVAFAVVSDKDINISNAQLEGLFMKKPFKHFKDLESAILWIRQCTGSVASVE